MTFSLNPFKLLFSSVTPDYKKSQIVDSISTSLDEITKVTLPAYQAANELFSGSKLESPELKFIINYYGMMGKGHASDNLITAIYKALTNSIVIANVIKENAEIIFSNIEVSTALTLKKATVLRLTVLIEFFNRYARRLLNYIYVYEVNTETKTKDYKLNPGLIEFIKKDHKNFIMALNVLMTKPDSVAKALASLSDAKVDALSDITLNATQGIANIDPLSINGFTEFNPFYIVGLVIAQHQASAFNSIEEEKQLLQYRYMTLKQRRNGTNDAGIDREMEMLQDRIDAKTLKWLKLKDKYGV